MVLKVYNTLTKEKEEFVPFEPLKVRMYVCGPTVYGPGHIGHARTYVAFDVIRRFLEYLGYEVLFVENITDIHDDMISTSNEMGVTIFELAERYIKFFFEDMKALGIKKATYNPRVTENIEEIISMIKVLEEKGYAYKTKDGVYYKVSKFKDYGKLSGIKPERRKSGTRIDTDKYEKGSSADFALWKRKRPGEPFWDSPWGKGRPGWHIECSVMSEKYLGKQFDIHGGAIDLIFPHHENEIAQSEAATGKRPHVKYWLHTGFLTLKGEKMSKSLGNYIEIRDLLERWDPQIFRYFLISTHYRKSIDFSEENLLEAQKALERIRNTYLNVKIALKFAKDKKKFDVEGFREEFINAMKDDFNTPKALATLFELVREVNTYIDEGEVEKESLREILEVFSEFVEILGINFEKERNISTELIDLILEVRENLREKKDFKTSDMIRARLSDLGVLVQDTRKGARWRFK
ncbi:MAG: cysteine--tRNA ligase [Candidatus Methanofastidiosia archaeon]